MSNREIIKKSIDDIHTRIEGEYPFNQLMKDSLTEKELKDFVSAFKSTFWGHIQDQREDSSFYQEIFNLLKDYDLNDLKQTHYENATFAYDYVFLGSRMGNQMVVSKNPKIKNLKYGDYFTLGFPSKEWKSFVTKLESLSESELEDEIKKIRTVFTDLINLGTTLK